LIFLCPILGGYLADRYLGLKKSVLLGALLVFTGQIILATDLSQSLYAGLSFLVLGVGFFKTNAICLFQQSFKGQRIGNSITSIYYVAANIGGCLGPILCAYAANSYGYQAAFAVSAVMMLVGIIALLLANSSLTNNIEATVRPLNPIVLIGGVLIAFFIIDKVINAQWTGYLLTLIGMVAAVLSYRLFRISDKVVRKLLLNVLILTLFATIFWIFDQQSGSSINLFVLRSINRDGIPAGAFQGIGSFVIVIFGLFMTYYWQRLAQRNIVPNASLKVTVGLILLALGLFMISIGARSAQLYGTASMLYPILGLSLVSMGELFIDPVIMSEINTRLPKNSVGFLTGMYMLFVGCFANYFAGRLAVTTAVSPSVINEPKVMAGIYNTVYQNMTYVAVMLSVALISYYLITKLRKPIER
jgi:POT family proton-dependent oligopeptide transporter